MSQVAWICQPQYIVSQLCWILFGVKKKWTLFGRRLIVTDFASNGSPSIENHESWKQQMKETVTIDKPRKLQWATKVAETLLGNDAFWHLRTFARKFSNIDFFLKILPLKDDELVMSEMQKKWGITDFVLQRMCPEEHLNLSKSGFISEEGHCGCKSQNTAIRALKGNVL